jgi:hypothetical protein
VLRFSGDCVLGAVAVIFAQSKSRQDDGDEEFDGKAAALILTEHSFSLFCDEMNFSLANVAIRAYSREKFTFDCEKTAFLC